VLLALAAALLCAGGGVIGHQHWSDVQCGTCAFNEDSKTNTLIRTVVDGSGSGSGSGSGPLGTTADSGCGNSCTELMLNDLLAGQPETLAPGVFAGLGSLTSLYLSANKLTELPVDAFRDLTNLRVLNLSRNQLKTLPKDIFKGLTKLEELRLADNKFVSLPEGIWDDLISLNVFYLYGNKDLGVEIEKCGNCEFWKDNVDDSVGRPGPYFCSCRTLELGFRGVKSIFSSTIPGYPLRGLTDLEELSLIGVPVHRGDGVLADDSFKDLTNLRKLFLKCISHCSGVHSSGVVFTSLGANAFKGLVSLESLSLAGNNIARLPEGVFAHLTNLSALELTGNNIARLPEGICARLTNLASLSLDFNGLAELSNNTFANCANLTHLYLNFNKLATLPEGVFGSLVNLRELNLQNNLLTSASFPVRVFENLTSLTRINLLDNSLGAKVPPALEPLRQRGVTIEAVFGTCGEDSYIFNGECHACTAWSKYAILIYGTIALAFMYAYYMFTSMLESNRRDSKSLTTRFQVIKKHVHVIQEHVQMFLRHMQLTTIVVAFSVSWPHAVLDFYRYITSVVRLDVIEMASPECLGPTANMQYIIRLLVRISVLMAPNIVFWIIFWCASNTEFQYKMLKFLRKVCELTFLPLIVAILEPYNCNYDSDEPTMNGDPTRKCDMGDMKYIEVIGIAAFWTFFLALYTTLQLVVVRRVALGSASEKVQAVFSDKLESLKATAWWWITASMLQTIGLAIISVFGSSMPTAQAGLSACIVVLLMVVLWRHQPFEDSADGSYSLKLYAIELCQCLIALLSSVFNGSVAADVSVTVLFYAVLALDCYIFVYDLRMQLAEINQKSEDKARVESEGEDEENK